MEKNRHEETQSDHLKGRCCNEGKNNPKYR